MQDTICTCPACGTEAEIVLEKMGGLSDAIVKSTSEEIVMEIACKDNNCSAVWRAVYSFTGNQ